MLHPGEFVLGCTLERIGVPDDLVGRIEGKSSLGRLGLLIHSTAGFIDAGFDGHITLELTNVATLPDHAVPRHEDRPGQLHADDHPRRQALRQRRAPARSTRASAARRRAGTSRTSTPSPPPCRQRARTGTTRRADRARARGGRARLDEPAGEIDDVVGG